MDVSSTTGTGASSAANAKSGTAGGATMGDYNTFLQLLIAQAKNQDPTNPTDPSQYVQQFAALAQVEQSASTNAKLDEIIAGIAALKPSTPPKS
ncbi:flagellar hook capping FlgD N-terminal domain-containing protein [Bosea thiooxidans]